MQPPTLVTFLLSVGLLRYTPVVLWVLVSVMSSLALGASPGMGSSCWEQGSHVWGGSGALLKPQPIPVHACPLCLVRRAVPESSASPWGVAYRDWPGGPVSQLASPGPSWKPHLQSPFSEWSPAWEAVGSEVLMCGSDHRPHTSWTVVAPGAAFLSPCRGR